MKEVEIVVAGPPAAAIIESELLKALGQAQRQAENVSVVLVARDGDQAIMAGITGSTSYGWLLVKALWVDHRHRGKGLGRALMDAAENRARKLGCSNAWLDTSNPEARAFYEALGYAAFGTLENLPDQFPGTHRRWFMRKSL